MHPETIEPKSKDNLMILKNGENGNLLNDFYLAGGTAVALHLGHRLSRDLDFFSAKPFDGVLLKSKISELGNYEDDVSRDNNTIGSFNDTKLSFMYFKPGMTEAPQQFAGVNIASIKDLMAMKVSAISQRGAKRDFIDLYFIMKKFEMSITDVMLHYFEKYKDFKPNPIHALKSLTYFDDAEKEIMPFMKIPVQWPEIKGFFEGQKKGIVQLLEKNGLNKKYIPRDFEPKS
jgi:hypothetical protein